MSHGGFLIDHCLSPSLADLARLRGHEAAHVLDLDLTRASDAALVQVAVASGRALVTNNGRHFRRLYAAGPPGHPGLVVIVPSLARAGQVQAFGRVLDALEEVPPLCLSGSLVEVHRRDRLVVRPLPAALL